ncbi:MAG: GPP34 family phosphoprotein [Bacteroidales bacterium]|jgi:hypothetical protein
MAEEEINGKLSFPELIILLALNDKGWFGSSEQRFKFGLAGAILFILDKAGAITISENYIQISSHWESGDKVIDSAFDVLQRSKKKLSIKNAIQRIVFKRGLKWKSIIKDLIKKEILTKAAYHFLWVLYQNKYPLVNTQLKRQIQEELYSKLMNDQELTEREMMLLSIMKTCRMIDKNFIHLEHFMKVRSKVNELVEFKEPLSESNRKIKEIKEAIHHSILASNVNLHI